MQKCLSDSSLLTMIRTGAENFNRSTGGCVSLEEVQSVPSGNYVDVVNNGVAQLPVQPADIGWPTGNGKKLSSCQAQLGLATCLAVASFLSVSCGPSYVRRLYM